MKKTILNLVKNKLNNTKSIGITSYDYPLSKIISNTDIDFVIIGDTLGSVIHGIENLNEVTMEMMLLHCASVHRGCPNKFLVGDMPFGTYQPSNQLAIENAVKFNRVGMDAVKIEGFFPERITAVDKSGIIVMSHLGLTPQTKAKMGGYRIQSKTSKETQILLENSKRVQDAGASLLLLEAVPKEAGRIIRDELDIPVFGIGAGPGVDGQLVISHDILGMFWDFKPRFVKQYINNEKIISDAIKEYTSDVSNHLFPSREHCYDMNITEIEKMVGKGGSSWKYT